MTPDQRVFAAMCRIGEARLSLGDRMAMFAQAAMLGSLPTLAAEVAADVETDRAIWSVRCRDSIRALPTFGGAR